MNLTASQLPAALKAAQPGDTLALEGPFGLIVIDGKAGLTFDLSAATMSAMVVKGGSDLTFRGGAFALASGGRAGVTASGTSGLTISGVRFAGDGTVNAVNLQDCAGAQVSDCDMERPRCGVSAVRCAGLKVLRNRIEGWSADAVGLTSVSGGEIAGNLILDPAPLDGSGIHVDAIQGYYTGTTPNEDIAIVGNTIRGRATQGVFFAVVGGGPIPRRIRVARNIVATADAPRGISLDASQDSEVVGNLVGTLPGSKWQTGISTVKAAGLTRTGNEVAAYQGWPAIVDPPVGDVAGLRAAQVKTNVAAPAFSGR